MTARTDAILDILTDNMNPYFNALEELPHSNRPSRLEQMEALDESLSPVYGWFRLYADYHYQVCNGGHKQYLDNGYHSTQQAGAGDILKNSDDVLQELISRTEAMKGTLGCEAELTELKDILKTINIEIDEEVYEEESCSDCGGNGEHSEWCDEEDDEITTDCDSCDDGTVEVHNSNYGELTYDATSTLRELDGRYYEVKERLLEAFCESMSKELNIEA